MEINTAARGLLFSTVLVEAHGPGGVQHGTAFLYDGSKSADKSAPLLISNRHVFADADELVFHFIGSDGGQPKLGKRVTYRLTDARKAVFTATKPTIDLAVTSAAKMLNEMTAGGDSPYFRLLNAMLIPTPVVVDELDAIEEVTFVGYPNAIFDQVNLTPVLRRGTTATPIQYDYNGDPAFLIDAAVFPGSSGSPVLIVNSGGYFQGGNLMVGASRVLFLGVVAAVHLAQAKGRLVPTALPGVAVDVPMGLGIVYRWDAVEEMLDAFFLNAGASRI